MVVVNGFLHSYMKLEIQAQDHITIELAVNGDCKLSQRQRYCEETEHSIFIAPENIDILCSLLLKAKPECVEKRSRLLKQLEGNL